MNILPVVVASLVTCAFSIKFKKHFIKKNVTIPPPPQEKWNLFQYRSSLSTQEIKDIELFLNYSAFHL